MEGAGNQTKALNAKELRQQSLWKTNGLCGAEIIFQCKSSVCIFLQIMIIYDLGLSSIYHIVKIVFFSTNDSYCMISVVYSVLVSRAWPLSQRTSHGSCSQAFLSLV